MSDEETQMVSSDGSGSEDDAVDPTSSSSSSHHQMAAAFEALRTPPAGHAPLVDHASLVRQMRQQQQEAAGSTSTSASSSNRLSKYEYARLKGARLEQLQRGAIPCVAYTDLEKESVYTIFRREFLTGRLPLIVIRDMPDGNTKYMRVRDFVNRDSTTYD